ncbi:tryptophan synthase beta subunit-like PLP-dependent enzyme [Mytilinidion resinicola]|uniref:Tryptophan synthase beta subunit-like PLP-dependent enzyme n=1 Tax=Mytilinidion resinicola TaxID=574789 RepID=A0A6A6YGB9_9PEZI|nr:tryptophan synthase beta subunit-like PLP-dependent enzyme [Mytilinidion resinicola]KAF2807639.1 tryptophan synthase beta subunit-like PLP-dependent enzyme [Mytilinidion resinicola]
MYFNSSAATYQTTTHLNPAVSPFHRRLPGYNSTRLVPLPDVAKELGLGHVALKDESDRFGLPAFKILGASWAIHRAIAAQLAFDLSTSIETMSTAAKEAGIKLVTCSEGNWGRAVARMANYLGIPATIFVPKFMDLATRGKIGSEGATVEVVQGNYDDSIVAAREAAEKQGQLLVMDTSWEGYEEIPQWVVEGYSTMLTETDRQVQELTGKPATFAIASVGVGSWAQAVVVHYKTESARATVATVEPDTAACLQASLQAGKITTVDTAESIMCGMNCGTVSTTAWPVLRDGVDVSVAITDPEAHQSVQYLHERGVMVGPCGAATLGALSRLCKEEKERVGLGKNSVVVLFSTEGAREYVIPT